MRIDYTFKQCSGNWIASCVLGDFLINREVLHKQVLPHLTKSSTIYSTDVLITTNGFGVLRGILTLHIDKKEMISLVMLSFTNGNITMVDEFTLNLPELEAPIFTKLD